MPMTGLTNAAIDLAAPDPATFAEPIAAYAATDLFCYRDDRDAALQAEQAAAWNPLLAWAEARYGVEFALTQGVLPIDQPETRSEEHTSELQSLMRISYAVFCLKKNNHKNNSEHRQTK